MWTSKVMFSKYFEMRIILEVFYSRKYLIEQYLMKLCIRNLLMEKSLTFDVFFTFDIFGIVYRNMCNRFSSAVLTC